MAELSPMHCAGEPRTLVLASGSPRRRSLLASLGLDFVVDTSEALEVVDDGVEAPDAVVALAQAKARVVQPRHPRALILAADTLVELDGSIFGKPDDASHARGMLGAMSGRAHRVYTGLVLLDTTADAVTTALVETEVHFRALAAAEIDAYVATGEPMDKAGAYGMQGLGGAFVEQIVGDYWNVVGLPLRALNALLADAGCCLICRSLHAQIARDGAE